MSHNYFFDTYKYIEDRLAQARRQIDDPQIDPAERSFTQGRLEALSQFRDFFIHHFESKLPRKLARLHGGPDDSSRTG